jgi:rhodanese-related sulfurtransferase
MYKHILIAAVTAATLVLSAPVRSYDSVVAESYQTMFAPAKGAVVGKEIHLIPAQMFVDAVKANKPMAVLDIRTPAETKVLGMALPETLNIPLNTLFEKANLERIPTDKPVIVFCQSGIRSVAAATALRAAGFSNVYVVKGGMKALIGYLGPKEANSPLKDPDK